MLGRIIAALWLGNAAAATAGLIHLKSRVIDTATAPSSVFPAPERRMNANWHHRILEFPSPVNADVLANLATRGVVVTSAIGDRSLMVSLPDTAHLDGLSVSWVGQLEPGDKISAELNGPYASSNGWVVEFHKDVPKTAAMAILRNTGLSASHSSALLSSQLLVHGDPSRLPQLASWDEVAYIFPASPSLTGKPGVRPCAGALTTGGTVAQFVVQSTGWMSNGPHGVTLNYVFTALTDKVPAAQVQSEIIRAMRQWSNYANVQFTLGTDPAAPWTVAIEFGTTVNNDPTPFDSTGTILAHTYYPAPPNPEPIAGDLHFNPDENWHVGATTDVYTVALHELGHALGLGHTDNPADVMYPYYRFGVGLSTNDIAGVQSLYGAPAGAVVTPPSITVPPLQLLISSPSSGLRATGGTATIAGTLLNASGSASVVWQSSNGQSGQATGAGNWSANDVPLSPGLNLITVTATDTGQQPVSRLLSILRAGSVATPSTDIPAALTITSTEVNGSLSLSGTASDPDGVSQVTWQTNSGASGTAVGTSSWTALGIPIYPGDNVIVIRLFNNSGMTRWTSITVQGN